MESGSEGFENIFSEFAKHPGGQNLLIESYYATRHHPKAIIKLKIDANSSEPTITIAENDDAVSSNKATNRSAANHQSANTTILIIIPTQHPPLGYAVDVSYLLAQASSYFSNIKYDNEPSFFINSNLGDDYRALKKSIINGK